MGIYILGITLPGIGRIAGDLSLSALEKEGKGRAYDCTIETGSQDCIMNECITIEHAWGLGRLYVRRLSLGRRNVYGGYGSCLQ